MKRKHQRFQIKDLVVLMYARNECYTNVVDAKEALSEYPGLSVDLKKGKWSYVRGSKLWEDVEIGRSIDHEYGCRGGVIGVYDRTRTEQLNSMVHHAREATREIPPMEGPFAED